MTMKTLLLASTAVFALSTGAYAADKEKYESTTKIEKGTNGDYTEKTKTSKTEIDGTTNISEKDLVIKVDSKGNTDKSLNVKTTVDPKGLGNKHIVTSEATEKTKDGEVTVTHKKTVNGKTVEGTKDSYKTESKTERDSKGNFEQQDITVKTEADGTKVSYEKNSKVSVGADGDVSGKVMTKEVVDPVGLNNKQTTTNTSSKSVDDGVVKTEHETKVDGKTVEKDSRTTRQ